jgi:hypothetical protein
MMNSWDMTEMDTNKDGSLSFDEFAESSRKQLRGGFDMIDTDGDGLISSDEWAAFLEVHGMKKS